MIIDVRKLNKDQRKVIDRFLKLRKQIKDLSNFWKKSVRPSLIYEAKQVFKTKGYGSWPDRKDKKKHPLLIKTSRLYNSWTKTGEPGNIFRYDATSMVWGSDVPYGKYHEYGTSKMPERPIAKTIMRSTRGGLDFQGRLDRLLTRYIIRLIDRLGVKTMFVDIRSRILMKVYEQCLMLLGPDSDQWPVNDNYLKQWNKEVRTPDGQAIAYEISDPNNLPAGYPLTRDNLIVLDKLDSFGLDARRIQLVQMGSKDWQNIQKEKLIPAIFIESANDSFTILDAETGSANIGEVMPINIRLVTVQAPDSELEQSNSNPIRNSRFRAALDYVLDPYFFLDLKEYKNTRKGYRTPSVVLDSIITATQNLEGQISPYEVVDYRLEVRFDRRKQLGDTSGGPNQLRFDPAPTD